MKNKTFKKSGWEDTGSWYKKLKKPSFAPPSWVFPIAWTILYPVIFSSFGYAFILIYKGLIPFEAGIPIILNLVTNFLYSPIQFGLRKFFWAAVDITAVLITLLWVMVSLYPYSKILAYIQIPYLVWVGFATILQYSISIKNVHH